MIVLRRTHVTSITIYNVAGAARKERGPVVISTVDRDLIHGLDRAMAGLTGNTCLDMTLVGEVYKVR